MLEVCVMSMCMCVQVCSPMQERVEADVSTPSSTTPTFYLKEKLQSTIQGRPNGHKSHALPVSTLALGK